MNYKARGIVLHTMPYGETSIIAFLLTDALGRQNYLIQGARPTSGAKGSGSRSSRKTALFQPMSVVDFEGVSTSRMQMHRMREAAFAMPWSTIALDVRKSTVALFMAEVLYRLVRESEANAPLFDFVERSVAALDALQNDTATANFHLWFLVQLSFHLGFFPGNEPLDTGWFDIENGEFTLVEPGHKLFFSPESTKILGVMMGANPALLHTIGLSRAQRGDFLNSMLTYFGYHLDGISAVRSVEILKEVF